MACEIQVLDTPIGATKEILYNFNDQMLFKYATPTAIADGILSGIDNYSQSKINIVNFGSVALNILKRIIRVSFI